MVLSFDIDSGGGGDSAFKRCRGHICTFILLIALILGLLITLIVSVVTIDKAAKDSEAASIEVLEDEALVLEELVYTQNETIVSLEEIVVALESNVTDLKEELATASQPVFGCPAAPAVLDVIDEPSTSSLSDIIDEVDAFIETAHEGQAGGSICVFTFGDDILLEKGYGYANIADEDTAPNLTTDLFRIGSITKVFSGLMLVMLDAQGVVNMNAPVKDYLPNFSINNPYGAVEDITLNMLAAHMGGIPRETPCIEGECFDSTDDILTKVADYTLITPPGSRAYYSNLGICLLGHALATALGTTFEDMVVDNIFVPLGMDASGFNLTDEVLSNVANGSWVDPAMATDLGWVNPSGGIYTTASDFGKFLRFLADPEATPSMGLSQAQLNMWMLPTQVNPSGMDAMGRPWEIEFSADTLAWRFGKSGALVKFSSQMWWLPDYKAGAFCASNIYAFASATADAAAEIYFTEVANQARSAWSAVVYPYEGTADINDVLGNYEGFSHAAGLLNMTWALSQNEAGNYECLIVFGDAAVPTYIEYARTEGNTEIFKLHLPDWLGFPCLLSSIFSWDYEEITIDMDTGILMANSMLYNEQFTKVV